MLELFELLNTKKMELYGTISLVHSCFTVFSSFFVFTNIKVTCIKDVLFTYSHIFLWIIYVSCEGDSIIFGLQRIIQKFFWKNLNHTSNILLMFLFCFLIAHRVFSVQFRMLIPVIIRNVKGAPFSKYIHSHIFLIYDWLGNNGYICV